MWERWLDVDTFASWGKLFEVIESPAVSTEQGVVLLAIYCTVQYELYISISWPALAKLG